MLINLLVGTITGFIVSLPPVGPVTFAIISKGFNNDVKEGKAIAFGAAFMDFVYALIAFGGIALIVSFLPAAAEDFYNSNTEMIQIVLTFVGCAVVIIFGLKILRTKTTYDKLAEVDSAKVSTALAKTDKLKEKAIEVARRLKVSEIKKTNLPGMFFMGALLCMTSLTIPASWIVIVGFFKNYDFMSSTFPGGLAFAIGAFAGTFGWFYTLLKLITGNKKRIDPSTVNKLNKIAGIILLILGVYLFVEAVVSVSNIF
jgi:threonine/homoserine/homoserine lactone efflux protein